MAAVRAVAADAERLAPEEAKRWRKRLCAEADRLATKSELVNGRSFGVRLKAFRRLWPGFGLSIANYLRVAFLLPRPLSDLALFAYVLPRNIFRRLQRG